MQTVIHARLSDGRVVSEKIYVRDGTPREFINDLAFKEVYVKYNTVVQGLTASFDWMTDDEINGEMDKKPSDELALAEIFYEHYKRYDANPIFLLWLSVRVWIASRTTWKWKWNWDYYVSIPFWSKTRPIRKKLGIHHFSDDAEGDC
jgi:hypothetical protein